MESSHIHISLDVARSREHRKTLITPELQSLYGDLFHESDISLGGMAHTLCGEPANYDKWYFEGLHHMPSGQAFWKNVPSTRPKQLRLSFEEHWPIFPYQPYAMLIRVVAPEAAGRLGGDIKTMFPKEYTAKDVLGSIATAYKTRSRKRDDRTTNKKGENVFVTEGEALHRDGKTPMPIFMVLDGRKKIITARPSVGKRSPNLNLASLRGLTHN